MLNHPDRFKSTEGYDVWAENKDTLVKMFHSAKWEIHWPIKYEFRWDKAHANAAH
jgi:hypothetical protein